jgi:dienelactone hydrolase
MGAEQLQTIWGQLSAQLGELRSLDPGLVLVQGGYHIVDMPASFQNAQVVVRVSLTQDMGIAGFWIRPPEPPAYATPPYVDTDAFTEMEVTVGADPWTLPGVVTLPKGEGPFPAMVLVHGSGPNDRDETIGGNRPFRDLAWGLASRGVAVLRYDKRTKVYGGALPQGIGLEEEVIEDALHALDLARSTAGIHGERVFVLGHSLGGMMAPVVAGRDGKVAGVAILAAPARPPLTVLKSQFEYQASLVGDPASAAGRQIDSLISVVEKIETEGWATGQTLLAVGSAYWEEWSAVDPVATAGELDLPILVLQGGRDYQSTPGDLEIWEDRMAGKAGFQSKLYPALNHLFAPGEGTATPEEYVTETKHMAAEVLKDLADWVKGIGGDKP